MEKERFIKSLPHVNASSLSPQRLQYQLNWTNGIGDINALCNCLRYFTIKQQVLYVGAIALGNHPVPVKLPTLLFLKESKVSFLESEPDDYSFRFLKKQNVRITSWFRSKVMQWLKCQLLSLLQLDHWWYFVMLMHCNSTYFSLCLISLPRTKKLLRFSQNPWEEPPQNPFVPVNPKQHGSTFSICSIVYTPIQKIIMVNMVNTSL